MKPAAASALRVGLLVIVTAALLIAMVMLFAGGGTRDGRPFETTFGESVQGLDVGAPVKFRGVTLGAVSRIALAASLYDAPGGSAADPAWRLVVVRFSVDPRQAGHLDLAGAVAAGLHARLASQGLTGLAYLELDYANAAPAARLPWTPAATLIPSVPSTFAVVKAGAEELLGKINQVDLVHLANDSAAVLHDLRGELESGEVHGLLTQSRTALASLQGTLDRADLPGLARQARATLASLQAVADDRALRSLMGNANVAVLHLTAVADKLPPLIAALQATGSRADATAADLQAQLGPILSDVEATMQNFRELSERLRQDPGAVLTAAPPARAR